MSEKTITNPATSDKSFPPKLTYFHNSKIVVKHEGNCLKQDKVSFFHRNVAIFFIAHKLDTLSRDLNTNFTLKDCLFRAVKLTKNADADKYFCSAYGIEFDSRSFL